MNILEKITLPLYNWDQKKGLDKGVSVFHCRAIITIIFAILFFDLYFILCYLLKTKTVIIFNRRLFESNYDWYAVGIISFVLSILLTTKNNWEKALENENNEFRLIDTFVVLLIVAVSYITVGGYLK